jgi:archaemetzincin
MLLGAVMQFKPPGEKERLAAIGATEGLSETLRRALEPGEDFEPVPEPGPSDWLANHPEPGQTFEQFVRSNPLKPDKKRSKLYLQPVGQFEADWARGGAARAGGMKQKAGKVEDYVLAETTRPAGPPLERLRQFAAAFFMMDVEVLPALDISQARITTRRNPYTGNTQLLTGDILHLLQRKLPDDAFALLGVTMIDLYPDESWNFVFGQASLRHRVGVYSFVRYDPRFYDEGAPSRSERPPDECHGLAQPGRDDDTGEDPAKRRLSVPSGRGGGLTSEEQQLVLRRSCKVLAHETMHMFGVKHCIYFRCVMNGSNHLAESDARPLHLCPVDLRKLQHSVGFDVIERYRRLHAFCQEVGFDDEAQWLTKRLERLGSRVPGD